eukprot:4962164-Pyramimonas_sp.AAC.1
MHDQGCPHLRRASQEPTKVAHFVASQGAAKSRLGAHGPRFRCTFPKSPRKWQQFRCAARNHPKRCD